MKKTGILNNKISEVIASMGHTDMLTICDAGFPIPPSVERIDLAVAPSIPSFLQVLRAVQADFLVDKVMLAEELRNRNLELDKEIKEIFPDAEVIYVPHETFKASSLKSRAIIRTGECTPYANVILFSGVTF